MGDLGWGFSAFFLDAWESVISQQLNGFSVSFSVFCVVCIFVCVWVFYVTMASPTGYS